MRMTYDPEADALMLRLSEAPVETSEEVAPNVVLDFDAEGRVVGVEVLVVCRPTGVLCESDLPDADPMELAFRVYRKHETAAQGFPVPVSGPAPPRSRAPPARLLRLRLVAARAAKNAAAVRWPANFRRTRCTRARAEGRCRRAAQAAQSPQPAPWAALGHCRAEMCLHRTTV